MENIIWVIWKGNLCVFFFEEENTRKSRKKSNSIENLDNISYHDFVFFSFIPLLRLFYTLFFLLLVSLSLSLDFFFFRFSFLKNWVSSYEFQWDDFQSYNIFKLRWYVFWEYLEWKIVTKQLFSIVQKRILSTFIPIKDAY